MSLKETKSLITTMCSNIDNDLGDKPVFVTLKQKFGCKPSHVCVGLVVLICTLSIFDIAGDILTTLFGMIYPAYMSFKAMEKKDEKQMSVWLTYWIVFGLLTSVDDLFSFVLDLIPGFYALRFIVYVWMFYPRPNNGSVVIYSFVKPYLQQWKAALDTKTL